MINNPEVQSEHDKTPEKLVKGSKEVLEESKQTWSELTFAPKKKSLDEILAAEMDPLALLESVKAHFDLKTAFDLEPHKSRSVRHLLCQLCILRVPATAPKITRDIRRTLFVYLAQALKVRPRDTEAILAGHLLDTLNIMTSELIGGCKPG